MSIHQILATKASDELPRGCLRHSAGAAEIDQLRQISTGAKNWLRANLAYYDPACSVFPAMRKVKAALELALIYRLCAKAFPDDPELCDVKAAVHRIWHDPQLSRDIADTGRYGKQFTLAYGAVRPAGMVSGFSRAALESAAPNGYLTPYGKSPYLRLETRYFADMAGLEHPYESYRALYEASILATPRTASSVDLATAYEITHIIFYSTDYGFRPMPLTDGERDYVCRLIDQLTDRYLDIGNWDLVGEFVLAQLCVGGDPFQTPSAMAGIQRLARVQRPDGTIPVRAGEEAPPDDLDESFRIYHHPTLVALLTSAVLLFAAGGD